MLQNLPMNNKYLKSQQTERSNHFAVLFSENSIPSLRSWLILSTRQHFFNQVYIKKVDVRVFNHAIEKQKE